MPPPSPPICNSRVPIDLYPPCATGSAAVENLGGVGPDTTSPAELRFAGVGSYNGQTLDVVVTVFGDQPLIPPPPNRGLRYSGCGGVTNGFGRIAIHAGTVAQLRFSFQDSATGAEVSLPSFLFSMYDIEQHEVLQLSGLSSYYLAQPTTVLDLGACPSDSPLASSAGTRCHSFGAPPEIIDVPNAVSTSTLTDQQNAASITFEFHDRSSFDVLWGRNETGWQSNTYDRRFWFSFTSDTAPQCSSPPSLPPAGRRLQSGLPTYDPSVPDHWLFGSAQAMRGELWQQWSTAEMQQMTCIPLKSFTALRFDTARTVRSNLGGQGGRCVTTYYEDDGQTVPWQALCDEPQPTNNTPATASSAGNMNVLIRDLGYNQNNEPIHMLITNQTECAWAALPLCSATCCE